MCLTATRHTDSVNHFEVGQSEILKRSKKMPMVEVPFAEWTFPQQLLNGFNLTGAIVHYSKP
jgi:hypothetical protein